MTPVGAAGRSSLTRAVMVSVHGPLQGPPFCPPLVYRARILALKVSPPASPVRVIDVSVPPGYSFPRLASLAALYEGKSRSCLAQTIR